MTRREWLGEHFRKYLEWRMSPHGQNVWRVAVLVAHEMIEVQGLRHFGMHGVIERIRFFEEIPEPSRDHDGYKVTNTYQPYLAREMVYAGLVPVGFYELIGGTPPWFIDWARRPDRLEPPKTPEPPRCPMCGSLLRQVRPTLPSGYRGFCPNEGWVTTS